MPDYWQFNQKLVGEILRRSRLAVGLSIRALAAESGVAPSQILRVESGEYEIRLSTFIKVASCIGVPAGLVLEQGMIANIGVYANTIGRLGIDELFAQIPTKRRKQAKESRLIVFCAHASSAAAYLLQSSNPLKLSQLVAFPGPIMAAAYNRFAKEELETTAIEDRVAMKRELETEPLDFLLRQKLMTCAIALEYLDSYSSGERHFDSKPNFFRLL
jgi:transcriptional regulator with XRE-family HTH domain